MSQTPTQQTLQRARERGFVPHSRRFTSAVGLAVLGTGLLLMKPVAAGVQTASASLWQLTASPGQTPALAMELVAVIAIPLLLLLGVVWLSMFIIGLTQTRFNIRKRTTWPVPLREAFTSQGFLRRVFGMLAGAFLVAFGLGHVATLLVQVAGDILVLQATPQVLRDSLAAVIALFVALGFVDLLLERKLYIQSLHVSPAEQQRQRRQTHGSPELRTYRRRRAAALRNWRLVTEGDEVLVLTDNRRALAVVLAWQPDWVAPRVARFAVDEAVLELIANSNRREMPIVDAPVVTRQLFAREPGQTIPTSLYETCAELLSAHPNMLQGATSASKSAGTGASIVQS